MKKLQFFMAGLLFFNFSLFAQDAPRLELVGSNVSLKKGTIDVETLSEIIQLKQEEVQERVFKNLVVSHFWDKGDNTLNNFSTQFFVYTLMKDAIEGKNKKGITKNMVTTASEFTEIFAFATICALDKENPIVKKYLENYENICKNSIKELPNSVDKNALMTIEQREYNKSPNTYTFSSDYKDALFKMIFKDKNKSLFDLAKVHYSTNDKENQTLGKSYSDVRANIEFARQTIPYINRIIDYSFEVIKDKNDNFDKFKDNDEFKRWFEANSYSFRTLDTDSVDKELKIRKSEIIKYFNAKYETLENLKDDLKNRYKEIEVNVEKIKKDYTVYAKLSTTEQKNIQDFFNKVSEAYKTLKLPNVPKISEKAEKIAQNLEAIYQILPLFEPIVRENKDEINSITRNQYNAIKFTLNKFSQWIKGHSKNDILSQLTIIFNNNFQFEVDKSSGKEETTTESGIAYVDIEAFIVEIFDNFEDRFSSRTKLYVKPFFEIGTNTLFDYKNDNKSFGFNDLYRSYFDKGNLIQIASEKIGVKFMLFNQSYSRNHKPGEVYKDRWGYRRAWLKPTKEPLFDDISITTYASGLLYNLVNIKSASEFNQPFIGLGLSFRFFNGLSLSANYAKTFKPANIGTSENPFLKQDFVGLNLDIPLIEYITAIRKKRTK